MNSRAKTLFIALLLGCMTRADELNWTKLRSTKIEIEDVSSGQGEVISTYPRFLQQLLTGPLSWSPEKQLNNSTNKSVELIRNLSVHFDVSDQMHFRKVWFHLSPTLKVRGLWGLHDFKTPRPLVILRLGIHGNVDEFLAERFIAKAVYENLDANFLILENLTSSAFLSKNEHFTFGGLEEGLHTFLILNFLTEAGSAWSPLISKIHLIGVSLGGPGTFVTALLDQANGSKISSVLNFCPLLNLQKTFEYHARSGWKNTLVDLWNYRRMQPLIYLYPAAFSNFKWWEEILDFKPRFTPLVLQVVNDQQNKTLLSPAEIEKQISRMKWPVGFLEKIKSSKSLDELNSFWPLFQGVKTPFKIYATANDPLVINELNSEDIFLKKQQGDFSNLKFEKLEKGIHCGLAPVYSWSEIVDFIRSGLK